MASLAAQLEALARLDADTGLLTRPLIATLGTPAGDDRVHLAAVWFEFDGEAVHVASNGGSRKVRNLKARPRAELLVEDRDDSFGVWGAVFSGTAEVVSGAAVESLKERVFARYVTPARRALAAVDDYLAFDDVVIRIAVERVRAWDSRDSEAAQAVSD
jgi:PPOX class probable F420-dependent enzyme